MTKAEIATEIAKTTGIDKAAVVTVIEQFMTVVKDSLAHGENVYLRVRQPAASTMSSGCGGIRGWHCRGRMYITA